MVKRNKLPVTGYISTWDVMDNVTIAKEMAAHSSVSPGESQGQGSLVGCRLWGRTESDMTEAT